MTLTGHRAPSIVVRSPTTRDLAEVSALLAELGYPTSLEAAATRLDRLGGTPDAAVFIADRDAATVGLATAHLLSVIHADDPVAMLTALVVAERHRGQGIGRSLVGAVEAWATGRGAYRITVASGLAREGAHAFYERLGFENTARRYSKSLR